MTSLVSLVCELTRHESCPAERGPDQPCYCACHYPEPSPLMGWACTHSAGQYADNAQMARPITPKMRQAIADYHKTHRIRRRSDA